MSENLPILWEDKVNSPELQAFLAQYGNRYCMTAEEINQLRNAVNEMAEIQKTTFLGVAEPNDTPAGTGAGYWEVITPGTYTRFGSKVLGVDERGLIVRDSAGAFKLSKVPFSFALYLKGTDVVNTLASTETAKPGSANNDRLLNEKIALNTASLGYKADLIAGKNKFNYLDLDVKRGFYLGSDGLLVVSSSFSVSGFVPVQPYQDYRINQANLTIGFNCYYDINKVFIFGSNALSNTMTTPVNAVYSRYTLILTAAANIGTANIQIEIGSAVTTYEAFKPILNPNQVSLIDYATKVYVDAKDAKIKPFVNGAYAIDSQVSSLGKIWYNNAASAIGEIPGTSTKWVNMLSGMINGSVVSGNINGVSGDTVYNALNLSLENALSGLVLAIGTDIIKNVPLINGYYISSLGTVTGNGEANSRNITGLINIKDFNLLTYNGFLETNTFIGYYDVNKNFISVQNGGSGSAYKIDLTIPTNAVYLNASINTTTITNWSIILNKNVNTASLKIQENTTNIQLNSTEIQANKEAINNLKGLAKGITPREIYRVSKSVEKEITSNGSAIKGDITQGFGLKGLSVFASDSVLYCGSSITIDTQEVINGVEVTFGNALLGDITSDLLFQIFINNVIVRTVTVPFKDLDFLNSLPAITSATQDNYSQIITFSDLTLLVGQKFTFAYKFTDNRPIRNSYATKPTGSPFSTENNSVTKTNIIWNGTTAPTLSSESYVLGHRRVFVNSLSKTPIANNTNFGVVKQGNGIVIADGVISTTGSLISTKEIFNNVLCAGDSITAGQIAGIDRPTLSYPSYLAKLTKWNVTTKAAGGASVIGWYNMFFNTVDYTTFDVAIFLLGQNVGLTDTIVADTASGSPDTYASTNTGQYCRTIEKILIANPKIKIYLLSRRDNTNGVGTWDVVYKIAQKYGLQVFSFVTNGVVDLTSSVYHPNGDTVHFGTIGNLAIANMVEKNISKDIFNNQADYSLYKV